MDLVITLADIASSTQDPAAMLEQRQRLAEQLRQARSIAGALPPAIEAAVKRLRKVL